MSKTPLNEALLEQLRVSARENARRDKSKTYLQWLDLLCGEHGFTYTSLKKRIEELEAQALAESLAAEDRMWKERLAKSRVWGVPPEIADQTLPLPVEDNTSVPWPHCFIESRLFSLTEFGPHRELSGPVFRMDGREMFFDGEELRVSSDQTLLIGFIMASRGARCGSIVQCSLADFEDTMGCRLTDLGIPMAHAEIERTLWRLSNCRLNFGDYNFDGPILAYADARRAPDHFGFAFNPAFANFYYPVLRILGQIFK